MLKLQIHCHFKRNWLSCFPICPDLGFSLVRGLGEGMFKIKKKDNTSIGACSIQGYTHVCTF